MSTPAAETVQHKPIRGALIIAGSVIAALAIVIAVGFATGVVSIYNGLNSGIAVSFDGCHEFGFETQGQPGFFTNDDCQ